MPEIFMNVKALLSDPPALRRKIRLKLTAEWQHLDGYAARNHDFAVSSAVMLLLGQQWNGSQFGEDVGLMLNKRSELVRQPGDICCPGGGLDARLDPPLARLLGLPGMPGGLHKWAMGNGETNKAGAARIALILATAMREGWEEMRLNPLRVEFLGPLPAECLAIYKRRIYPLVGWCLGQKTFKPNWEVAAIPFIPLKSLLEPHSYVGLEMIYTATSDRLGGGAHQLFGGFRFDHMGREEILWGATYRIVVRFLELIFDFHPPPLETLPVRQRHMAANYMQGRPRPTAP